MMKSQFVNKGLIVAVLSLLWSLMQAQAYYDPTIQRWINRDPLEEPGGINLFVFAKNNPVSFVDRDVKEAGYHYQSDGSMVAPTDGSPELVALLVGLGEEFMDEDGYTHCYSKCILGITTKTGIAELGGATYAARRWYTWRYPRWFTACGRHSKVMVPRLATRLSGILSLATLKAVLDCVAQCGGIKQPELILQTPYIGGPVNMPPAVVASR